MFEPGDRVRSHLQVNFNGGLLVRIECPEKVSNQVFVIHDSTHAGSRFVPLTISSPHSHFDFCALNSAFSSDHSSVNFVKAAWSRDFTVPTGIPRISAAS